MPLNVASRILPYALLLFVGVAGWAMNSAFLLSMDVVGIVAVAIGTSVTTRGVPMSEQRADENQRLI